MATEPTPREEAQALLEQAHLPFRVGMWSEVRDLLTREVEKRRALEANLAEAASEINCAGPVAHRIRVLREELSAEIATLREQLAAAERERCWEMTDHPTPVPLGEEDMAALRGYIEAHPDTFAWHVRLDSILATIDSLTARLAAVEEDRDAAVRRAMEGDTERNTACRDTAAAEARVRQLEEALRELVAIATVQEHAPSPYMQSVIAKANALLSPPIPAAPEGKE